jgi:hypothetical protein
MDHSGGCLCGAVRYRASEPLAAVVACHCSQCRRQSGHFSAWTAVPLDRFWLERDTALSWYRATPAAERGFCRVCGSSLFWKPADQPRIFITAGTLDGATGLRIAEHLFCADKGDYYDIDDDVPHKAQW